MPGYGESQSTRDRLNSKFGMATTLFTQRFTRELKLKGIVIEGVRPATKVDQGWC